MSYVNESPLANAVVEQVVKLLTVPLEASGRHVHLSKEDVFVLFGAGHTLTPKKELSQPGQFACEERVTLVGPKGRLENVAVLGPERVETQVELSLTDGVALGIVPPVRLSGDTADTPGVTLQNGAYSLTVTHGLIAAMRHIHMSPADAARFGVTDGQRVALKCLTKRPATLEDTVVRVSDDFCTSAHLDYDEANAAGFQKGDRALIVP